MSNPQIERLQFQPFPEATPEEAHALIPKIISREIAGLVIRHVGIEDPQEQPYRQVYQEHDLETEQRHSFILRFPRAQRESWHIDAVSAEESDVVTRLHDHYTERGTAHVSFVFSKNGTTSIDRAQALGLMEQGLVDTTYFEPVCWTADLEEGTRIIVPIAGFDSPAHQFKTTSEARVSHLWIYEPLD
jgi:hypothetical protein